MTAPIVILGAGVAGLTAAHELAQRGLPCEVWEARGTPGGKARSIPLSGERGRLEPAPERPFGPGAACLHGEHGFRFVPGFYRHLPDTLSRIPFRGGNVADRLVLTRDILIAPDGGGLVKLLSGFPVRKREILPSLSTIPSLLRLGISVDEWMFFLDRIFTFLSTSDARRLSELEATSWWDFVCADEMSEAYRRFLCVGLTRSLVAMKAEVASTRTIGAIFYQLCQSAFEAGGQLDRVLDGPTNEVWIEPWVRHLESLGVRFRWGRRVEQLELEGGAVVVQARDGGAALQARPESLICALPLEVLIAVAGDRLRAGCPSLPALEELHVDWMNGIQLYFREPGPPRSALRPGGVPHGHTNHVDSPWALTSIWQDRFWRGGAAGYGTGEARALLSVDISDWERPGVVYGRAARDLDHPAQIRDEVLAQLRRSLGDVPWLRDENLVAWFLDPAIRPGQGGAAPRGPKGAGGFKASNGEPLLVNTLGSWKSRPETDVGLSNMLLAGDYTRTHTDLATMEGANESGRRAAGILLGRAGLPDDCPVWPLREPAVFRALQARDADRHRAGLPALHPLFPSRLPQQREETEAHRPNRLRRSNAGSSAQGTLGWS